MTKIAVLGNGRVGGNLAAALARAGHEVTVADRTPGAAADAARTARIVINATPGAGSLERLIALREELQGKILVDVSNATVDGPDGLPASRPKSILASRFEWSPGDAAYRWRLRLPKWSPPVHWAPTRREG